MEPEIRLCNQSSVSNTITIILHTLLLSQEKQIVVGDFSLWCASKNNKRFCLGLCCLVIPGNYNVHDKEMHMI